ncbi:MAG TPA: hypothetical protein VNX65_00975 [Patescibacteria group bacterium]|nr:hypothetical protein [Patescibacteria group bacterium]
MNLIAQQEAQKSLELESIRQDYMNAVVRLIRQGKLDRSVYDRLPSVGSTAIAIGETTDPETGRRFAEASQDGRLKVPNESYLPHELTHFLFGVHTGERIARASDPLDEGLVNIFTKMIADEMNLKRDEEVQIVNIYSAQEDFAQLIVKLARLNMSDENYLGTVRLSRIVSGEDRRENFNRLAQLVQRSTGHDVLDEFFGRPALYEKRYLYELRGEVSKQDIEEQAARHMTEDLETRFKHLL